MKNTTSLLLAFCLILTISCKQETPPAVDDFDVNSLAPEIKLLGKNWGKALKSKDLSLIKKLYDKDAHYLPDGDMAIGGNESITKYWEASMDFLLDIQLSMRSLEGTKELLYETGDGIALIMNQTGGTDTLAYKYVNVWKRQEDGSYKVVIDTYNDLPK